ncbi:MAG: hypothetical protein B5M56_00325 [Desulfococcus sp. 4484_241]|nr:MAG: hypothetical protein B5M56_00325 [Desulfococcus sp. 4484_241]
MDGSHEQKKAAWPVAVGIALFVLIVYSNTLHVPFLFDDYPNIVNRPGLHIGRLTVENIIGACARAGRHGRVSIYRPVSNLTFALNYCLGGLNVTGYHLANIVFHIITALFLFKTILLFLGAAGQKLSPNDRLLVAGVATLLWAIHPMQIQAVTYIVQRMALLAAMFYIIGLWACARAFTEPDSRGTGGVKFLAAGIVSFFLAVGSKENAVLLPAGVLLAQSAFFSADSFGRSRRTVLACTLFMAIAGVLFAIHCTAGHLLDGYACRPFDLKERLLTEPRVLFFYVYQLFLPLPENFSIDHSFAVSTSLFAPATTIFAIAGLLATAVFAFMLRKRYPFVCFPWLFFLLSHVVESTILPLEIMFEHRNYLPSMFMFLPFAVGIRWLLDRYRRKATVLWGCVAAAVCFIFMFVGMCTYVRNYDWRSAKTLWESAISRAPDLARPFHNLAWYYERKGDTKRAIGLYRVALEKRVHDKRLKKGLTLESLANIYYRQGQYDKAKAALERAIRLVEADGGRDPGGARMLRAYRFRLAMIIAKKDPNQALGIIRDLVSDDKTNPAMARRLYTLGGDLLLGLGKPGRALDFFRHALDAGPGKRLPMLNIGAAFGSLGNTGRGLWFLAQLAHEMPGYAPVYLYMAENRIMAGSPGQAKTFMETFVRNVSLSGLSNLLNEAVSGTGGLPPLARPDATTGLLKSVLQQSCCPS